MNFARRICEQIAVKHGQLSSYRRRSGGAEKQKVPRLCVHERHGPCRTALPQLRPARRSEQQPLAEAGLERPRIGDPLAPCFIPVGFSVYGAWVSGARHLLDCVAAEVKDVFGPGETGPDE